MRQPESELAGIGQEVTEGFHNMLAVGDGGRFALDRHTRAARGMFAPPHCYRIYVGLRTDAKCQKQSLTSLTRSCPALRLATGEDPFGGMWPHAARAQRGAGAYSFTLIPASLINFAHCGISDLIIAANCGGVLATISMPRCCRCLRTSFCARTRAVSL
jgi:hypothetical protein